MKENVYNFILAKTMVMGYPGYDSFVLWCLRKLENFLFIFSEYMILFTSFTIIQWGVPSET